MKFQSTRKDNRKRKKHGIYEAFHIRQCVCCFCYHHHYYYYQHFIILARVGRLLLVCTVELHKRSIIAPSILDKNNEKGIDFV